MKRAGWAILGVWVLTACGGYDAEYDCEQGAACQERIDGKPVTQAEIDFCEELADEIYDSLSDDQQDLLDEVFEECEDKESCEYIVCGCDYVDSKEPKCDEARDHL